MKTYIGTKIVNATPMSRGEYNDFRGWHLPPDENGDDAGYLVEYTDGGKANTAQYKGYVSWSPKDVFERAYKDFTPRSMNFGGALEALKCGMKVARQGWNGKGMWLSLSCSKSQQTPAQNFWSANNAKYANEQGGYATVLPCITMKTATGEILMGWLASQTDMLAEDWMIV